MVPPGLARVLALLLALGLFGLGLFGHRALHAVARVDRLDLAELGSAELVAGGRAVDRRGRHTLPFLV